MQSAAHVLTQFGARVLPWILLWVLSCSLLLRALSRATCSAHALALLALHALSCFLLCVCSRVSSSACALVHPAVRVLLPSALVLHFALPVLSCILLHDKACTLRTARNRVHRALAHRLLRRYLRRRCANDKRRRRENACCSTSRKHVNKEVLEINARYMLCFGTTCGSS